MMCSEYSQFSEIIQNPLGQSLTKATQQTENVTEFTGSFKNDVFHSFLQLSPERGVTNFCVSDSDQMRLRICAHNIPSDTSVNL